MEAQLAIAMLAQRYRLVPGADRVGEPRALRHGPSPFAIVTGASAGAINGSLIAALAGEFRQATNVLERLWSRLRVDDVFRSDPLSLGRNALRLGIDIMLGGMF